MEGGGGGALAWSDGGGGTETVVDQYYCRGSGGTMKRALKNHLPKIQTA